MIKAMESGAGSISTTHAANAEALRKLVTCAMEAGAHVTHEYATEPSRRTSTWWCRQLETTPLAGGAARRDRWLSEIIAVTPGERERGTPRPTSSPQAPAGSRSPGCCPMSTGIWSGMASICPASTPNPARWRRDSAHPGAAGALLVAGLIGIVAGLRRTPNHLLRRNERGVGCPGGALGHPADPDSDLGRIRGRRAGGVADRLAGRGAAGAGRAGRLLPCCSPPRRRRRRSTGWRRWRRTRSCRGC